MPAPVPTRRAKRALDSGMGDPRMTSKIIPFPRGRSFPEPRPPVAAAALGAGQIAERLRYGICPPDSEFDQFLTGPMRAISPEYWTPLVVACRAAEWFGTYGIRSVIDIGSGVGKFCICAALAGRCQYTGLEHRERLVVEARRLALTFDVDSRVQFIHGALGTAALPTADAYYLFNPFEENVVEPEERIDAEVELSRERQARDCILLRELLSFARVGTYVLTYNGAGATLPPTYRVICANRDLPNALCLSRKEAHGRGPSQARRLTRQNRT